MYDLVVRNGTVVDGTGLPRYRADVGISGERIAAIGRVGGRGKQEIDASGHVVTPGFIDGHTHMDAQVFWDKLGSCSCWHGVTTVVMGNCGFTLAPGREAQRALVLSNLEKAEDISAAAMECAIRWQWTHFREFMDVLDRLPKAINYAAQVGHSALRTYVMDERAFEQQAAPDDLAAMERELRDALSAGAIGFSTSLSDSHVRPDGGPVASRQASWEEIRYLVCAMGETGHGVFELAREREVMRSPDPAVRKLSHDKLRNLAVESGVPITFGITPGSVGTPDMLRLLDDTAEAGGRMFGQTHPRGVSHLLSFRGKLQFDMLPEWQAVRTLPVAEQLIELRKPDVRRRLIDATKNAVYGDKGGETRAPDYENMHVVRTAVGPNPSVIELAAQRGVDPVEVMIDCALETGFDQFFMQFSSRSMAHDEARMLETLLHPRTVMTFSDSGAHVGLIMDSSIQTHLLAYWVRERQAISLEQGVRMITLVPAMAWNLVDRGVLRTGSVADINVFDPAKVAPELPTIVNDLPAGAWRLKQKSTGIKATIIGGKVAFQNGEHTGELSGKLLRSSPSGVR